MNATWNPRPDPKWGADRCTYHAGYSDAFHGYRHGAGQEAPQPAAYGEGYTHGTHDRDPVGRPIAESVGHGQDP